MRRRMAGPQGAFSNLSFPTNFCGGNCVIILHVSQISWSIITVASFQYLHLLYWNKMQLSVTLLVNNLSFQETALKMLHLQWVLTRAGQKPQNFSYKNHVPFLVECFQPSLMCHFVGESPNQDLQREDWWCFTTSNIKTFLK